MPKDIDIFLSMSEGGGEYFPMNQDLFYFFGESIVEKMSVGGVAMIQLPLFVNSWMIDYVKRITDKNGLNIKYFPSDQKGLQAVLIINKLNSTARLPLILTA